VYFSIVKYFIGTSHDFPLGYEIEHGKEECRQPKKDHQVISRGEREEFDGFHRSSN
jgi:hypothetical protein